MVYMLINFRMLMLFMFLFCLQVQAFSCEQGSELIPVKNDDRPLQKLVECLDHAFLHG